MRKTLLGKEFVVTFSYPKGKVVAKNKSHHTECVILAGAPGSLDNEKQIVASVNIRRDTRDKFNLSVAREHALKRALTESKCLSKGEQVALWQNRTIRRAGAVADITF